MANSAKVFVSDRRKKKTGACLRLFLHAARLSLAPRATHFWTNSSIFGRRWLRSHYLSSVGGSGSGWRRLQGRMLRHRYSKSERNEIRVPKHENEDHARHQARLQRAYSTWSGSGRFEHASIRVFRRDSVTAHREGCDCARLRSRRGTHRLGPVKRHAALVLVNERLRS